MKKNLKQKLASMSKDQKLEFLEAIKEKKRRLKKAKPPYVPHEGQLEIHTCDKRNRFAFAANGCWGAGTRVRMADGSTKKVEDIEEGDYLLGPEGGVRTVIQTYAGEENLYKITPSQSDPYVVNESHNLSLQKWVKRNGKQVIEPVQICLKDYLAKSDSFQRVCYQWRPPKGVAYKHRSVPIDPYVLGVWLGDGGSKSVSVTTADEIVVDAFRQEFSGYKERVVNPEESKACTYFFSNNGNNPALKLLRKLDLYDNKHIPKQYMINDRETRYQVLAGLVDTDGYLDKGLYYEIMQKNQRLSEDIRELAQSLGFRVTIADKVIEGQVYKRMLIAGDIWKIPTRIEYKQASPDRKKQREYWREQFTVEGIGVGNFYGFQVAGIDNLILLDDYTVQCNSGKTTCLVQEVVAAAKGYNPWLDRSTYVPARVVVVLDRPDKVEDVFLPELRKWFDTTDWSFSKEGKPYITRIVLPNGSNVKFMFKEADPLAFEGIEADYIFMDEPVPRKIWVALQRAGRTKGREARYMFIGTPIAAAWLRTDIYEPWVRGELEDVECFRFGTELNRDNLQDGFIETFYAQLSEKERRVRLQGEFFDSDGLALADVFKRETHVISKDTFKALFDKSRYPCVLAIDPHSSKPHHACLLGVDGDSNYYYIKEIKAKEVPRKFAKSLKEFMQGFRIVDIVVDSSGQAEGTGAEGYRSFIDVLKEEGIQCRATSFKDKSDEDFVDRIKSVLAKPIVPDNFGMYTPKLRVVEGNKGIITDIETVGWQKYRDIDANKPKLEIRERDYLACLKYALASGINPKSGREKPFKYKKSAYGFGRKKRRF